MNPRLHILVLAGMLPLAGCNSIAKTQPTATANIPPSEDYRKLGGIHAHHTPEQHAAFLRRVGQLPTDEAADGGGPGGGGGGHHH